MVHLYFQLLVLLNPILPQIWDLLRNNIWSKIPMVKRNECFECGSNIDWYYKHALQIGFHFNASSPVTSRCLASFDLTEDMLAAEWEQRFKRESEKNLESERWSMATNPFDNGINNVKVQHHSMRCSEINLRITPLTPVNMLNISEP